MQAVNAVNSFKAGQHNELQNEKRQRDSLLKFMAQTLKTRQETEPAFGYLVDLATADPLHLANNAWELVFFSFITCPLSYLILMIPETSICL